MENTMKLIEKLRQDWRNLTDEVKREEKIKIEEFEEVFSQTYSLLSEKIEEKVIEKNLVGLIAEAYLFASIKDDSLDNTCLAAFVLTERMLNACAFGADVLASSMIYIAEARREVRLDFGNVNEAVSRLAGIFEEFCS